MTINATVAGALCAAAPAYIAGNDLQLLNFGGGFPAFHGKLVKAPRLYAAVVDAVIVRIGDATRYQIITLHDVGDTGPCVLAGPSCDSADILCEKCPMNLRLALRHGDKVMIQNCGADTSSYSSVGPTDFRHWM